MKASELHIGCTVSNGGYCYSVSSVSADGSLILSTDGGVKVVARIGDVEGIPLDDDILSRSFGEKKSDMYTYIDSRIMLYIYERCPSSWVVSCDWTVDSEYHEQVIVQYVHELENFLEHVGYFIT